MGTADPHPEREPPGVRAEPMWIEQLNRGDTGETPFPTETEEYVSSFLDRVGGSKAEISESLRLGSSAIRMGAPKWGCGQQEVGSAHQLKVLIKGC